MNYVHRDFTGGRDTIVRVSLDSQANVMLLDDSNYSSYRSGRACRGQGGLAKVSPVMLRPPHYGRWHVVVDLGGYAGTVQAEIAILN